MINNIIKKIALKFICISGVGFGFIAPNVALADYSFDGPSTSWGSDTTESSFSINKDSMSCSSGGGSTPSLWVGAQSGNSDIVGGDLTDKQADDFVSAGIGFTIPLGSPGNKGANCKDVMAILEAEEFLKMIETLQAMDLMDEVKTKLLVVKFMKKIGDHLDVDLVSAMKTNFETNIDKEDG